MADLVNFKKSRYTLAELEEMPVLSKVGHLHFKGARYALGPEAEGWDLKFDSQGYRVWLEREPGSNRVRVETLIDGHWVYYDQYTAL
jgi:hypothetical protein